jgi:NitT/TauT family transport system ATP-binding protein
MTNPQEDVAKLLPGARPVQEPAPQHPYQMLPHVSIGSLAGFIERLHHLGGREDLYEPARDLHMEADDLLPLTKAADLLRFAEIEEGDVYLTPEGRHFAEAGVLEEKEVFRNQAMATIELLRQIVHELQTAPDHRLREDHILEELEQHFSEGEARRQLDTAIDWGHYAELFAYDDDAGQFSVEDALTAETGI